MSDQAPAMTTYLALLRGINVGGHARIAMDDLRRLFAALGHADVRTYIQSGNVIFRSPVEESSRLAGDIERRIVEELGLTVRVLLRTKDDLARIVASNPFAARETEPKKLLVTFLADTPDPDRVARLEPPAGEPVELSFLGQELYLVYHDGYGRSKLSNTYLERRLGLATTTRNWRVVTTLRGLMGD